MQIQIKTDFWKKKDTEWQQKYNQINTLWAIVLGGNLLYAITQWQILYIPTIITDAGMLIFGYLVHKSYQEYIRQIETTPTTKKIGA